MSYIQTMRSVHISEFSGLMSTPGNSLLHLAKSRYTGSLEKTPFVLFTDPVTFGRGIALFKFLEGAGMGKVYESEQRLNPNSHRQLKVYIFIPDDAKLQAWYEPRQEAYNAAYEKWRQESRNSYSARFTFDAGTWKPDEKPGFIETAKRIIKSVGQ